MKTTIHQLMIAGGALLAAAGVARATGTAFTCHGSLNSSGAPATGIYDLTFTLYPTNENGLAVAGPVTNLNTFVTNGVFTSVVDFGPGVFNGANYWLELGVRAGGTQGFETLTPRQPVVSSPRALYASPGTPPGRSPASPRTPTNRVDLKNNAPSQHSFGKAQQSPQPGSTCAA